MADERSVLLPNLPRPRTRLIGREAERATVKAFLIKHMVPLVTLVGAGGVGKTRLALAVAEDVAGHYADGIVWIDLAPLSDPLLIPQTTAEALTIPESADRSITNALLQTLHTRQILLIFDNCEHLLEAVAPFVNGLLSTCPALQVLTTSRVRLGLSREQVYRVAPLDLPVHRLADYVPDLATIGQSSAVHLFVVRAQGVEPAFALTAGNAAAVSEICQRVDGLPLAIELAAAHIRHLTPAQLLDRLSPRLPLLVDGPRDQPQRLRTMHDAIAWSYDLLPLNEQDLFRSLAVFVGGCTLEAAEHVITMRDEEHPATGDIFASVGRLLDKSLLYRTAVESVRFDMLETIREFAQDELRASGAENAMRDAHAAYYLSLAERADPELPVAHHFVPPDLRLDPDLDNVRAALTWLMSQGRWHVALRLAASASWTWKLHGRYQEGIAWLEQALEMSDDAPPTSRIHAKQRLAALVTDTGNYSLAETLTLENLEFARAHHDDLGIGRALMLLGVQAGRQGDQARDGRLHEEALAAFRAVGNPYAIAHAVTNLADWAYRERDYVQAQTWSTEALALGRSLGHAWFVQGGLTVEAQLALEFRQSARAALLYLEMATLALGLGAELAIASSLSGLAGVAVLLHHPERATRWLASAQASLTRLGAATIEDEEQFLRSKLAARAMLSHSQHEAAWIEGGRVPPRIALAEAMAMAAAWQAEDDPPHVLAPAAALGLSPREVDVLRLLIAGRSDPEIASALSIGRRTAQSHVSSILKKLQVSNRTEAASVAVREHLIQSSDPCA